MDFEYKKFRIDASCLEEGGHYYARAKIYLYSLADDAGEVKWSGDIGDFGCDADAVEAAQQWAIRWCDANENSIPSQGAGFGPGHA